MPENIVYWLDTGVLIQRACRNYDRATVLGYPGERRSAASTKTGGKVFCLWMFETTEQVFTAEPFELFWVDDNICRVSATGELAAA